MKSCAVLQQATLPHAEADCSNALTGCAFRLYTEIMMFESAAYCRLGTYGQGLETTLMALAQHVHGGPNELADAMLSVLWNLHNDWGLAEPVANQAAGAAASGRNALVLS